MHEALRKFTKIAAAAAMLLLAATGAHAQRAPNTLVQQALVKVALLTFNDANLTGNYSVFHARLAKPFRDKYFSTISGVWQRRSSEVAQTVVIGLYPSWDVSQGALDAADEFLADPEVPPALRRLVLEGRAGVERSLRARAFDAG